MRNRTKNDARAALLLWPRKSCITMHSVRLREPAPKPAVAGELSPVTASKDGPGWSRAVVSQENGAYDRAGLDA